MDDRSTIARPAGDHPYRAEINLEHERWTEIAALCRSLDAAERIRPGYFRNPDWSVKDLVAHLGTWMAEAEIQLLRIEAGTYVEERLDIDGLNAQFLEAMRDQGWDTVWGQAVSARVQMLTVPRLRAWVGEMREAAAR